MIGLYNGSHAGRAIADAHGALRAASPGADASLLLSMRGASVQVMSFLVNATKGSSVASMIGVPELLNALTDITSFTSERIMTYSFLLVFYSALVLLVVWATRILQRRVLR
jgi:ABC-type amino acid transport system permease subunit